VGEVCEMNLFSILKTKRILLIDDDEWIRDSMTLFFEGEGCHIKAIETAEEGFEELNGQEYEIIIVDYRLPGMDGLTFLEEIKELYPSPIKILISAYGNEEIIEKARAIGIQDYIQKPFTSNTIEVSLAKVMETYLQD
jgi:CheY-like chemotaxis protein